MRARSVARHAIAVLPACFTLGNLLCGFLAIFYASRPAEGPDAVPLIFGWTPLTVAAVFIFLGMIFDGLDGRIARLTRSVSDLGEQLDSMADMVTFGVAPAFVAIRLAVVQVPYLANTAAQDRLLDRVALVIACIYVCCAALRLARFNLDAQRGDQDAVADHNYFKGLPSPGAAGTVAALILLHQHYFAHHEGAFWATQVTAVVMLAVTLLTALAMVSSFRYVHLLNRYVGQRAPFHTTVMAVVIGLLLLVFPQEVAAAALVAYALSAPLLAAWRTVSRPKPHHP